MGCSVRTNRHGYLCFRLYFDGLESHEGTAWRDTPENRAKVERRAAVINDEMERGEFDYLRWFPEGNQAHRFRKSAIEVRGKRVTIRGFFGQWGAHPGTKASTARDRAKQVKPVSAKWAANRASAIRTKVLPRLGRKLLDELTTADLVWLQRDLCAQLAPWSNDAVIFSALPAMIRDAKLAGYETPNLRELYDREMLTRLARGARADEPDPYDDEERDLILHGFWTKRQHYFAFVLFMFWTGARPSEAIALRYGNLDLAHRRVQIRRSRVLGQDGRPKTGRSRRDIVIHDELARVLRDRLPTHPAHDDFVFTSPRGAAINEANFYRREWVPMLRRLGIRPRPFYNTRHTYISFMLAAGARPLWVARQTGTSLKMIEEHYGSARMAPDELDDLIADASETRNPPGTLDYSETDVGLTRRKNPDFSLPSSRAGDRGRTGDVQLGKLAFYR
jgi:integrase